MKRPQGFTLVEVLVASTILFMSLGLSILAFQSSIKTIESAEQIVRLMKPLPIIVSEVERDVRYQPLKIHKKNGVILGVNYYWEAIPISFHSPANRFDPDKGDFVAYEVRYALYNVTLNLRLGLKEKTFRYQKLGWSQLPPSTVDGEAGE